MHSNEIKKTVLRAVLLTALLTFGTIAGWAQCDGLPHPENGQPAPCFSGQNLPYTKGPDLREQEEQQRQRDAEYREQQREQHQRCEEESQQAYENCRQRNPNGYCYRKSCL